MTPAGKQLLDSKSIADSKRNIERKYQLLPLTSCICEDLGAAIIFFPFLWQLFSVLIFIMNKLGFLD